MLAEMFEWIVKWHMVCDGLARHSEESIMKQVKIAVKRVGLELVGP